MLMNNMSVLTLPKALLGGLLCLLQVGCTGLFFYPEKDVRITPENGDISYENISLEGEQGALDTWWMPAQGSAKGTVIFAHGNAGNMGSHIGFVYWLPKLGYNLFMFDYRGYGRSGGKPTAMGLVDDTQRVIAYVQQREEASTGIVLYGHSLGGATGLSALATLEDRVHIRGAIIDSAFVSYRGIAREKVASHWLTSVLYPLVPLLITGNPVPEQLAAKLSPLPVYISHSPQDEIIPISQGQRLFDSALEPKQFYPLKAQQHNHGWQHEADRRWFLNTLTQLFSVNTDMPIDPNKEEVMLAP